MILQISGDSNMVLTDANASIIFQNGTFDLQKFKFKIN